MMAASGVEYFSSSKFHLILNKLSASRLAKCKCIIAMYCIKIVSLWWRPSVRYTVQHPVLAGIRSVPMGKEGGREGEALHRPGFTSSRQVIFLFILLARRAPILSSADLSVVRAAIASVLPCLGVHVRRAYSAWLKSFYIGVTCYTEVTCDIGRSRGIGCVVTRLTCNSSSFLVIHHLSQWDLGAFCGSSFARICSPRADKTIYTVCWVFSFRTVITYPWWVSLSRPAFRWNNE